MFDRDVTFPMAVASKDDEGVRAALDWSIGHMEDGDTLTVWTSQQSNLRNSPKLDGLVRKHSNVEHITGRGGGSVRRKGPVLMAWASMDDIGKLVAYSSSQIRALCVITWNDKWLRPWVHAAQPTILGDGSAWEVPTPGLHPLVVAALTDMTQMINHNNTISVGFEKDVVLSALYDLHGAGIPLEGKAMQGWALAHGWSGDDPEKLSDYVDSIRQGKRLRYKRMLRADYMDELRREAGSGQ